MFQGKRELLASGLYWSGAAFLLDRLPPRDVLLVLNYHRIGNREEDLFDPGVFSATADQFNEQIAYLKRHCSLVTLDEAKAFIEGTIKDKSPRYRVLITFDDGYLDNYELAFPVLRSHDVQGVFFLVTSNIGSGAVPWWDHIAFLLKTAENRRFSLHYPVRREFNLDKDGIVESIRGVLSVYKRPDNTDTDRFIQALQEQTRGADLPKPGRRFLDWNEAREMIGGRMEIGSHTHSHTTLSQLAPKQQRRELGTSHGILKDNLGVAVDTIAYPVGATASFTEETQVLARQVGYRIAFSSYGGTNLSGQGSAYDVKRVCVHDQSRTRFRTQLASCRVTGRYWP
jgi:peptidoglycan/xylan/chitin deacetylase (PgdA/CDA1 family)